MLGAVAHVAEGDGAGGELLVAEDGGVGCAECIGVAHLRLQAAGSAADDGADAGGTEVGGEAQGGYQYAGRTYVPRFKHAETMDTCTECHNPHTLRIDPKTCSPCHANVVAYADIGGVRQSAVDHDGDGDTDEGIVFEIQALHMRLYDAIRDYAASVLGTPIAYHPENYPYYFVDSNDDGRADGGEAVFPNRYVLWSPRLLRAAYNYQFVGKDPGGFVHGPQYQLQLLYDSLDDLSERVSVEMAGLARPWRAE